MSGARDRPPIAPRAGEEADRPATEQSDFPSLHVAFLLFPPTHRHTGFS
jgi:hypothetical protein